MRNFKDFLTEREKTEHEGKIRQIVSKARKDIYHQGFKNSNKPSQWGDCHHVACHVANELHKHYPSTRVMNGSFKNEENPHTWIEIPEIKHFVDPTHDQMTKVHKKNIPDVKGHFPDNAVKIGHMLTAKYKAHYINKEHDDEWEPGFKSVGVNHDAY